MQPDGTRPRRVAICILAAGAALLVMSAAAFPFPANPWLSRKGEGSPSEASEYYATLGAPATFGEWLTLYSPPTGEVRAVYANAGDLGFGRDMHCNEIPGSFVACYVVNHGLGPGAPTDMAVEDARSGAHELPTVAMTYIPGVGVNF